MDSLKELLVFRTLRCKELLLRGSDNPFLLESLIESSESKDFRNVCAKLSVPLADELDQICSFLDLSKRRFIEAALIHAIDQAKIVLDEFGIPDIANKDFEQ